MGSDKNLLKYLLSILVMLVLGGCVLNPVQQLILSSEKQIQQVTTTPTPSPTISPTQTPTNIIYPPEAGKIRLAWFYKPPEVGLDDLPTAYSYFILTHKDEQARDRLKELGVQKPIFQYLLMSEIMDPGSCEKAPYNNQVAFKPGDFCWIQANYPDWFLTGIDGKPIGEDHFWMMDAGNSGWLNFWLERASLLQDTFHWDSVFLDNVEASLEKLNQAGETPSAYRDDASYQAAIEAALKQLYTGYFQPNGKPLYANIIAIRDPQVFLRYLQYLDGAMLENFATGWPGEDSISAADWEAQMAMVSQAQAMGKEVILVSQGAQDDTRREEFALASYLLVSDGLAYFRYTHYDTYDASWIYPNYTLDLGAPLGPMYEVGDLWRRDFSKGSVSVNPSNQSASINTY